jgi:serine/threonine protein kinase
MSLLKKNESSKTINEEYRILDKAYNNSRKTITYICDPKKDLIGEGGFAEVYREKKESNNQEEEEYFALKKIDKQFLLDKERKHRILTEIKIHRNLIHKNICKFEHSFEDKNFVYILIEYCPLKSLNEILKKRGRFKEYEVRYYMFQVLEALMYLKRRKIIHRDLTLANIFLKNNQTVKIGDFGLSFIETENDEKPEFFCGTDGYFAPETLTHKLFTYKSDIFAFGVCIYIALTGKNLFNNPIIISDIILKKEIPYDLNSFCSEECKDLLNKIFTSENERISLNDIFIHPFFNKGIGLIGEKLPLYPFSNDYDKENYYIVRKKFEEEIEKLNQKVKMSNIKPFKKLNFNFDENNNNNNNNNNNMKSTPLKPRKKRFTGENFSLESPKVSFKNKFGKINYNVRKNTCNLKSQMSNNLDIVLEDNNNPTIDELTDVPLNLNKEENINEKQILLNQNNFENLLEKEIIKKNNYSQFEDNIIQFINLGKKYGLGYKLYGGDIGILFCDGTGMLKLKNSLLYLFKDISNKKDIIQEINYPQCKECSHEILKKIKILENVISEFEKINFPHYSFLRYNLDEFVYLKKWKKNSKAYFFILSNNNIQIIFDDNIQIIFYCHCNEKKIKYIDEEGKDYIFLSEKENFFDIKCEDNKIRKKINYAMREIVK